MKNYTYREGDKILKNLQTTKNKKNKYYLTPHIKQRAKLRSINIKYIEKMLLTEEPLGILSTRRNRFKLFYPHETKNTHDLIILIAIDDDNKIIGLTVYDQIKRYREGVLE